MSGWLQRLNQVSTLLEQLDDQVETAVEERVISQQNDDDDDDDDNDKDAQLMDTILAKRGLHTAGSMEEGEDDDDGDAWDDDLNEVMDNVIEADVDVDVDVDVEAPLEDAVSSPPENEMEPAVTESGGDANGDVPEDASDPDTTTDPKQPEVVVSSETDATEEVNMEEPAPATNDMDVPETKEEMEPSSEETNQQQQQQQQPPPPPPPMETTPVVDPQEPETAPAPVVEAPTQPPKPPTKASATSTSRSPKEIELIQKEKQAQKEVRQLRRHVVSLNTTLEQAEQEIQALRGELGTVAERMEKDRLKAKEQKESAQKQAAEQLAAQKAQYEQQLQQQQQKLQEQLKEQKKVMEDLEYKRRQEGGDWNKEMEQAMEREQEMQQRVVLLEDEKAVFLNQISTLQNQQATLGVRLESLSQAAESAMAREKEADDRLDETLTQHARQISQRQAREAELERTIQELNAALVAAGSKAGSAMMTPTDDEKAKSEAALKAHAQALEGELDLARSQLQLEKERCDALRNELKGTTQETVVMHSKHVEHRLQVAELESTISKLQAELTEAKKQAASNSKDNSASASKVDEETLQHVRELSEEVLRLREKLAGSSSESKTLRMRLQAATQRANKAEDDLAAARTVSRSGSFDDMERATGPTRRRKGGAANGSSMRSAMRLGSGQGERTEQIGKVVDAVDSFAVTTGKYLRRNPLARASFILYLVMVHLWTFVVLFFHAHNFEDHHLVPGAELGVGPHALVAQQHLDAQAALAPPVMAAKDAAPP
eukprot:Nitzschia sp. Nitz4//scaffold22_size323478//119997//122571//NITZ4_000523-RA/size323478-augustus-gene-0.196-mRNA-1//1//CDS//3329542983//1069//frame0